MFRYFGLVCVTIGLTASFSAQQGNDPSSSNLNWLDNADYIYVGGMQVPLQKKVNIPYDPFLQNGLLRSLYLKPSDQNNGDFTKLNYDAVSSTCQEDVNQLITSLADNRTQYRNYATQMFDADAKIPSGISQGNIFWFGSFDQCSEAESPVLKSGRKISGRYCVSTLSISLENNQLSLGVCVPNSCNGQDVTALINSVFPATIRAYSSVCAADNPMTTGTIVTMAVCGVVCLLCLVSTVADALLAYLESRDKVNGKHLQTNMGSAFYEPNERTGLLSNTSPESEVQLIYPRTSRRGRGFQLLTAFSFISNTRKLLSTSTSSGPLASLNGLRVLSMWWVILGHTFVFTATTIALDNGLKAYEIVKNFWFQPILNGTFSVDTFFFMSGLLVTYLLLKNLQENGGKCNWALFYFHRFWRLTPVYGFLIMIWGSVLHIITPGPPLTLFLGYLNDVPALKVFTECSRTWWANILYINNFYPHQGNINTQCMGWSWYLANDMQFFLVSPLIIILLYKYKRVGICVCGFLIAACIFIRAMTTYEYGIYVPSMKATKHVDDPYVKGAPLYSKPYTRMAPYIVGMLLGYTLHIKNCRAKMSKLKLVVGWLAAILIGGSTVYGLYDYYHNGKSMSLALGAVYVGFERFAWSVALAWLVYACVTGYGGLVNSILSWNAWGPLGRLTYCAYLVHPIVMEIYLNSMTGRFHFSVFNMVYLYFGNLVASYLFAYVVSMAVEAPMLSLEKIIFKR